MKLKELLDVVTSGYPEDLIRQMYTGTGTVARGAQKLGDTLALYVVREIQDTYDPGVDDWAQLDEARRRMSAAIRDLTGCLDATQRALNASYGLLETTDITSYVAAGGNPESEDNQAVRRRMVNDYVSTNLSGLIYELTQEVGNVSNNLEAELQDAQRGIPDYREAAEAEYWLAIDAKELADIQADIKAALELDDDNYSEVTFVKIENLDEFKRGAQTLEVDAHYCEGDVNAGDWEALCREARIDYDNHVPEIYEHYLVDNRLARWLVACGEKVVQIAGLSCVWCRGCTGQGVYMDYCMAAVAAQAQRLVGQKYYEVK